MLGIKPRRPVMSVVGNAGEIPGDLRASAFELGELAVDAGFRVLTGGMDGVMAAVSEGARRAAGWTEGTVVGVLPGRDPAFANPFVDIVIPTGIGLARNAIVVSSGDVVVALGGGSGTLSEMAYAWQFGCPVIALVTHGGWAQELAGRQLDGRFDTCILEARTPEEAVSLALQALR